MFVTLLKKITKESSQNFDIASNNLTEFINKEKKFIELIKQIGTIPESIPHDSTEEKLFSKASDAVLARAFRELGLKASVIKERADTADVIAKSQYFGYTLVADAKAFRLSRTAKNQKDFKVSALSCWRKDSEYAVLCGPYFQYPKTGSQIYSQAIDNNVCLLSWEHILFMIKKNIKETERVNMSAIWGFSGDYAKKIIAANQKKCFLKDFSNTLTSIFNYNINDFELLLNMQKSTIRERAQTEKAFWENEKKIISAYSKGKAIRELIATKKINEKIKQIDDHIARFSI